MTPLRIHNLILPDIAIEHYDFTLHSDIEKVPPTFEKGRKARSLYTYNEEIVVE